MAPITSWGEEEGTCVEEADWILEEMTRELDRQVREIERLLAISGSFTFVMDKDEIAAAVLREVSETNVDRSVIAVFEDVQDRDPAWLELVARYDRQQGALDVLEAPIRIEMSDLPVMGRILLDKAAISVPSLDDGDQIPAFAQSLLQLDGMSSVALVPLIVMGWPVGALVVARRHQSMFLPVELGFLQIVANLAAMALRAVHLLEDQKRTLAEQNAAYRVSQAIAHTLELSELLQVVYQQINTVIDAHDFYIALYDPFHDEVSFPFVAQQDQHPSWANREMGSGLTEYVLRTRQPLLLADRAMERLSELGVEAIGAPALSWMGVPMIAGETVIGMIGVQNFDREHAYTRADLDLLAWLANQVAVAVQNARLYESVRHQALYLRLNAELGRWITQIRNVDQLLSQVVEMICVGFGFYYVDIGLIDETAGEVVYRAGHSAERVTLVERRPRIKVGQEGIIGWVASRGEPLLVNDVHQDIRYLPWVVLPDTQSELAVPIQVRGKTIGVLNVESDVRNAFHPHDIPMMFALADQIAVAVENAQLFGERERQIQELAVLAHVGQALCTVVTRAQLLESVHEQVAQLMDAGGFFVALYDPAASLVRLELVYENGEPLAPFTFPYEAEKGLTGWVIEHGRPLLIQDLESEVWATWGVGYGHVRTRSWLGVPIVRCEQVIGVMGVQSVPVGAFDEHHQALLATVAAQLAMALGYLLE